MRPMHDTKPVSQPETVLVECSTPLLDYGPNAEWLQEQMQCPGLGGLLYGSSLTPF